MRALWFLTLVACESTSITPPIKNTTPERPVPTPSFACTLAHDDTALHDDCERECTAGQATACAIAALNFYSGHDIRSDGAKSLERAIRACELGAYDGCELAGTLYLGARHEVAVDRAKAKTFNGKALALYEAACAANDYRACNQAGYWVGGDDPVRGAALTKKAVELEQKACDGGDGRACNSLGVSYSVGGSGVAKDAKRAAELYAKGCEAGHATSCDDLASEVKDDQEQQKHRTRACELGLASACQSLSTFHPELRERACTLGAWGPCEWLAEEAEKKGDHPRAKELYGRACALGSDSACRHTEAPGH